MYVNKLLFIGDAKYAISRFFEKKLGKKLPKKVKKTTITAMQSLIFESF